MSEIDELKEEIIDLKLKMEKLEEQIKVMNAKDNSIQNPYNSEYYEEREAMPRDVNEIIAENNGYGSYEEYESAMRNKAEEYESAMREQAEEEEQYRKITCFK
jgi:chromosome segregation ATPase